MIYRDEIIAEVWRNRDAYAAQHHNSLNEMVADLRERQNGRPSGAPKTTGLQARGSARYEP